MDRRQLLKLAAATGALGTLAACGASSGPGDIVDIASSNPNFSTLVAALSAADLVGTLQGPGPFTVFAPTNAAFDALPAGTVENLLLPENKAALQDVLLYHVVPGAVTSDQIIGRSFSVDSAQGSPLRINGQVGKLGGVRVNDANVTTPDIIADNGVIHVIDRVLLP
ncbi:MAG: fasciclin domain-containing protein [Pseudomonadota bacterium]